MYRNQLNIYKDVFIKQYAHKLIIMTFLLRHVYIGLGVRTGLFDLHAFIHLFNILFSDIRR